MGPGGAAAVAVGLWLLVTVTVAADPGVSAPPRCLLSHYHSLDPREMAAVKALRDRYVSDAQHPHSQEPWVRRHSGRQSLPRGPRHPSAQQAHLGCQGPEL